ARSIRVTILRPLALLAVIAGIAFAAVQWRSGQSVAAAAPIHYAVETAGERFPAAALDVPEHGRGPLIPATSLMGFAVPIGYELPDDPDLRAGFARTHRGGLHAR